MMVVRRIALAVLTLAGGGGAVALMAPGGLGTPTATVVTEGPSARAYRAMVAATDGAPGWLGWLGTALPVLGLLGLAGLLAWAGWRRRRDALLVGVGAVLAYLASEAIKLVVDEERPCRVFRELTTWAACPPGDDWSFPSNHATVAGALAAGVALLAPRLGPVAVVAAIAVAGMRVVIGVHYPHDAVAGLLLGSAVTVAVLVVARRPTAPRVPAPPPPRGSAHPAAPGPR
jgi:membrane-associated phospholipid phosphatase